MTKLRKTIEEHFPEVAAIWNHELNDCNISTVFPSSTYKAWFNCSKGHPWIAMVRSVTFGSQGCAVCRGFQIHLGFNDLATTHPHFSKQWVTSEHNLSPLEVTAGAAETVIWKCDEYGHEWEALVSSRTRRHGAGKCPVCINQKILIGFNDLESQNPILITEWDYDKNRILPSELVYKSDTRIWWKCSDCSYSWQASPKARTQRGTIDKSACNVCLGRITVSGINDLKTKNPPVMEEWDYEKNDLDPFLISAGDSRKAWWICNAKQHSFYSSIPNRVRGSGCPDCRKGKYSKIENKIRDSFMTDSRFSNTLAGSVDIAVDDNVIKSISVDIQTSWADTSTLLLVEYDGEYWHGKSAPSGNIFEKDKAKTRLLLDKGYTVIRIRENALEPLDIKHNNLIQVSFSNKINHIDIDGLLETISNKLAN